MRVRSGKNRRGGWRKRPARLSFFLMTIETSVRALVRSLALCACLALPVGANAQSLAAPRAAAGSSPASVIDFDIPAQRADRALTAFARQAGVTLVFRYEEASRRRANALVGRHPLAEGLEILLRDTGLQGAVETAPHLVIRAGTLSATLNDTPKENTTMNEDPRRSSLRTGLLSGFIALVAGTPAVAQDAARATGAEAAGPVTLEEVVVTARKRSEKQIDVPIALTTFSGEDLDRRGVQGIGAVLAEAPGVNLYDRGGSYKLSIRGISTSLGSNENGYYLDELPFTGVTVPINPDVRAWDIDRIEVLRGPQGTLFGEGSMGGTVRILTRDPEFNEWDARLSLFGSSTSDGGTNRGAKAMVNIPIVDDRLALRLAGTKEKFPGWIDDAVTGAQDLNRYDYTSYRAKLKFKPTEKFSLGASYWHYKADGPGGDSTADDAGDADRGVRLASAVEYSLAGATADYDFGPVALSYSFADNVRHRQQEPDQGRLGGLVRRGHLCAFFGTHRPDAGSALGAREARWTRTERHGPRPGRPRQVQQHQPSLHRGVAAQRGVAGVRERGEGLPLGPAAALGVLGLGRTARHLAAGSAR